MSSPLVSLPETTDNDDRDEKTMTTKPALLLDIDGVCNLFPRALTSTQRAKGEPYPEIRDHGVHRVTLSDEQTHPYMLRIPSDLPGLVSQLAEHFDIHWYTMWNDSANRVFAPLAGIPEFPVLECDWEDGRVQYWKRTMGQQTPLGLLKQVWIAKTPLIEQHLGDRPFVWVDDDSSGYDDFYLDNYAEVGPHHLITVTPHTGLTQAVVDEAIDWARTLANHPEEISA